MPTTLNPTTDETRVYECAILVGAGLSDKEYSSMKKEIQSFFGEKGGKLLHTAEWGRMGLAYTIKGNREGRYIFFYYELEPEHIPELDKNIRLEKGVLRHMIIKLPENYEIVDWTAYVENWKEEREKRAVRKAEEREEELKKKIVKRVAKKPKEAATPKKETKAKEEVEEKQLEEKLGEIISDEDLNL